MLVQAGPRKGVEGGKGLVEDDQVGAVVAVATVAAAAYALRPRTNGNGRDRQGPR